MSKRLNFFFISVILCIALACSAGCVGYHLVKDSEPTYTEPTEQSPQSVTENKIPVPVDEITPKPGQTLVSRVYNNPAWDEYTSFEDQFVIQTPYNWKVLSMNWNSANAMSNGNIVKKSTFLDKIIFVYTPDLNGFIIIYGTNSYLKPPTAGGFQFIPDSTYDDYVQAVIDGYVAESDYTNIRYVKDDKLYVINGNAARAVTVYCDLKGEPLTTEVYFIDTGDKHYIVAYGYSDDVNSYYTTNARNVMNSFKPF